MRSPSSDSNRTLLTGIPVVMTLTLGDQAADADGSAASPPVTLSFADLFMYGVPPLTVSAVARRLHGQRIRLVGSMAPMERRRRGGFYLCPRPVPVDEQGGTAELPPEAVRVTVPAVAGRLLAFVPGRVEVIGILDVGQREEGDGEVSGIRLTTGGGHPKVKK